MVFDVGMRNTRRLAASLSLAFIALASVACTADASAAKQPTCDGKRANIVGTAGQGQLHPEEFRARGRRGAARRQRLRPGRRATWTTSRSAAARARTKSSATPVRVKDLKFFGDGGADELGSLFEQGKRVASARFQARTAIADTTSSRAVRAMTGSRAAPVPTGFSGLRGGDVVARRLGRRRPQRRSGQGQALRRPRRRSPLRLLLPAEDPEA